MKFGTRGSSSFFKIHKEKQIMGVFFMKLKMALFTVLATLTFSHTAWSADYTYTKLDTSADKFTIDSSVIDLNKFEIIESEFIATESCAAKLVRRFDNDDYDLVLSCAVKLPKGAKLKSLKAYEEGYASLDQATISMNGWSTNRIRNVSTLCSVMVEGGDGSASAACEQDGDYQAYTITVESEVRYNRNPAPNQEGSQLNLAMDSLECIQSAGEGAEICQISRDATGKSYVPLVEIKYTL